MAAAMFMNSNSLPIALMQSLVVTVPGLKWGTDDNKDAMVGRALTYLVLYSTLGMVVRTPTSYNASYLNHQLSPPHRYAGVMVFDYWHMQTTDRKLSELQPRLTMNGVPSWPPTKTKNTTSTQGHPLYNKTS